MPVYNGERFLEDAIQSIRNQTLRNWELLVLDDGSTDQSAEIADRFASTDPRVRVLRLPRGGLADALNRGIEEARASWIARMDADDISLPTRLERQLSFLEVNPDVAALGTYGSIISANGRIVGKSRLGPTTRDAFWRSRANGLIYLQTPSVVFSRFAALEVGGFRKEYSPGEDVDFWTRLADNRVILAIPDPLILYRIHNLNQSTREYAETLRNLRRSRLNADRRRAGMPELSIEDYNITVGAIRPLQRMRDWMRDFSQLSYRRAGTQLAVGRPVGVIWLVGSLVYPPEAFRRLRRQGVAESAALLVWRRVQVILKPIVRRFLGRRKTRDPAMPADLVTPADVRLEADTRI